MKCVKFLAVDQQVCLHLGHEISDHEGLQCVNRTVTYYFVAEEIKELWEEYENNSSVEANIVKDFDKVRMMLFCELYACHFCQWILICILLHMSNRQYISGLSFCC
jgi:hypothetical protein